MASGFYKRLHSKAEGLAASGQLAPEWLTTLDKIAKETRKGDRKRTRSALLFTIGLLCGASFIGGILLLAGSRWSEYSPSAHLVLGALPLALAALFGFWAILFSKKQRVLECAALCCALGTLLCVFTVSTECFLPITLWEKVRLCANFFFLPLIYVFCGTALALIETVLLIIQMFITEGPASWPIPLALLLPFLIGRIIVRPASAPARWAQGALIALLAALSCRYYMERETVSFAVFFAALIALPLSFGLLWQKRAHFNLFRFGGEIALIGFTATASFSGFWKEKINGFDLRFHGCTALAEIIVVILWLVLLGWALKRKKGKNFTIFTLLLLPVTLLSKWGTPSVMAWLMALYFILFAVKTLVVSCKRQSVPGILYGGVLLLGLGIAHFLELENIPKAVAGAVFIVCGLLFGGALFGIRRYFKKHTAPEVEK